MMRYSDFETTRIDRLPIPEYGPEYGVGAVRPDQLVGGPGVLEANYVVPSVDGDDDMVVPTHTITKPAEVIATIHNDNSTQVAFFASDGEVAYVTLDNHGRLASSPEQSDLKIDGQPANISDFYFTRKLPQA